MMLRIGLNLHLAATGAGYRAAGMSAYCWRLAAALARHDDRHQFVLFHAQTGSDWPSFQQRAELRRTAWTARGPLWRIAWEQLGLPLAAQGCDVVHCPVNVMPLGLRCPALVTVHDLAFLQRPNLVSARRQWYLARMVAASVRRARIIIAISEQTRTDIIHTWQVPAQRIRVIPPAIDPAFRPPAAHDVTAFCQRLGLARPFVLFMGTIEPRKNLEMLVRAFALACARGLTSLDLVIAGAQDWEQGQSTQTLVAQIHSTGLAGHIHLPGYVPNDERQVWYGAARALVLPSWYEGFGLPAAEAMACGTPVLASNAGSLPEVVGAGGWCLPPTATEDWAEALLRLEHDLAWRDVLAQAALRQAERFSEGRMVADLMVAYEDVGCQNRAVA